MKPWMNWVIAISLVVLMFLALPLTYTPTRSADELSSMFKDYIQKFNKTYENDPAELEERFKHFVASVQEIDKLNAESQGPDHLKAQYGLTHLSDMSKMEFTEIHLSDEKQQKHPQLFGRSWRHRGDPNLGSRNTNVLERKRRAALPLTVDWRTKGVIGPIRNQGLCGACWAFSTVGIMEAMAAIDTGKLETLSVQEVIDCAGLGNNGCAGGDICLLLDWLTLTGTAIETDKEYPLRLVDGACSIKKNVTGVKVKSFTCDDFVGSETSMLEALATHGPLSVAVNALTWQNYLGGVIQFHCSGDPADLNHAVEIVGYDLTADVPYYIVKNSWGKLFGNAGYMNIAVGTNVCGLANEVATVSVK